MTPQPLTQEDNTPKNKHQKTTQHTTTRPIITANQLHKAFGQKTLWTNLTFNIHPGETIALTGISGSGKTTLLNILGLLEKPDAGTLTINGTNTTNIRKKQRQELYRHTIAFLFQNYALVDSWTINQNLDIALKYTNKTRENKKEAKNTALEQLGLAGWGQEKIYTLSGGEQQRVALARLLLKQPKIILADEPTAALDTNNSEIVLHIIQQLKQQGTAIILSTHDNTIATRCDTTIKL